MSEPIIKFNDRGISVAIFKFENDGRASYSADIQRSYKKKGTEEWVREEIHCFDTDLLAVANACTQAYSMLVSAKMNSRGLPEPTPVVTETDSIPF